MNRRDVLFIALKIFGLQFVVNALAFIPNVVGYISLLNEFSTLEIVNFLVTMILFIIVYCYIPYAFIFRTEKVLDLILKRDSFEQNEFSNLKIHRSTLLSICIIVIGGVLFVNSLSNFIYQLWSLYYYGRQSFYSNSHYEFQWLSIDGIKILIAICLMSYHKIIISWIDKRRKS